MELESKWNQRFWRIERLIMNKQFSRMYVSLLFVQCYIHGAM